MDNHEEILDALSALGKNPNPQEIPQILEQYLKSVAKSGETLFPWSQLKPLILRKMELVILELRRNLASENIPTRPNVENVRFDVMHARIIDSLHKFNGAPFTIQRLCELLIEPKRHYKRSDKFMRGLEKNVLVVSTVDPFGRKVVCESGNKPILNGGLDINGSYVSRDGGLSVPLPPVPGWVNTPSATSATSSKASSTNHKDGGGASNSQVTGKENGMSNSVSSLTQQSDSLPIQSEEVVEETVVTMDTGEASSDAGEAMADRDVEEMAEDRDASSFSSSSSSSEELSTSSDSVENMHVSPFGNECGMNEESTMDEQRPWAAFAQNIKQDADVPSLFSSNDQSDLTLEGNESSVTSSSIPSNVTSSPSSLSTKTPTTATPAVDELSQQTNSSSHTEKIETDTADQSFGFDCSNSDSEDNSTNSLVDKDKLVSSSSLSLSLPTTTSITVTSSINSSTVSTPLDPTLLVSSSGQVTPTYAQVVASSSTDNQSNNLVHPDISQTEICDSVAGLERLVGSVEADLTSTNTYLNLTSSSLSTPLPEAINGDPISTNTPSIPECSDNSDLCQQLSPSSTQPSSGHSEPACKRLRLSDDESSMEADCISTSEDLCSDETDLRRKRPASHLSMETTEDDVGESETLHENMDNECDESTSVNVKIQSEDDKIDTVEPSVENNEAVVTGTDSTLADSDSVVENVSDVQSESENEVQVEAATSEKEKSEKDKNAENLSGASTSEAVAESTTDGN